MSAVLRLARRELAEAFRNYWFAVNSGVFVLGALALLLFGQQDATVLGYRGVARALAGLMQLTLFLVPLMALFPAAAALAGEREVGTLDYLLAQPVTRGEVHAGKWLGVGWAVGLSLLTGFTVAGAVGLGRGVPAGMMTGLAALAVLLAAVFVSLGTWISARAATQGRATSLGLTVWLFLLALGSLGLMGAFVAWGIPPTVLEVWAFVNPVEAFRMAVIVVLDPGTRVLGPVGADLVETLGRPLVVGLSVGSLIAWSGVGFWAGRRTFEAPVRAGRGGRPETTGG